MGSEKPRERPLQRQPRTDRLVSSHSGHKPGLYGLVCVKFHFHLWAGWALMLSCGLFLAKVDRYHPCLSTAQIPHLFWAVWAEKILLYLGWKLCPCGISWVWGQCP